MSRRSSIERQEVSKKQKTCDHTFVIVNKRTGQERCSKCDKAQKEK